MKELDLLKKHWNEQKEFPKVSQEEILKMMHRKSSSVVMWILIISIIEFLTLNTLGYFFSDDSLDTEEFTVPFIRFIVYNLDYLSVGISAVFIYFFYKNYNKIKVQSSTKNLMEQILRVKKIVNSYISFNIILMIVTYVLIILDSYSEVKFSFTVSSILLELFKIFFSAAIFMGLIWAYYKIVYGILIKRLMKNYRELEKIDYN